MRAVRFARLAVSFLVHSRYRKRSKYGTAIQTPIGWYSVLMLGLLFWGYLDHVKAPHPISTAVNPEMEHRQKVVLNGVLQEKPKALQAGAVFVVFPMPPGRLAYGSVAMWIQLIGERVRL